MGEEKRGELQHQQGEEEERLALTGQLRLVEEQLTLVRETMRTTAPTTTTATTTTGEDLSDNEEDFDFGLCMYEAPNYEEEEEEGDDAGEEEGRRKDEMQEETNV